MGGFAWVTLATNDSYSLGALVLAHSLRQVNTAHQLAVLVTPGVTSLMREKLASVFNVVKEVNILDSRDEANLRLLKRPELGITFTKLHCWRLTQFDKCVFLDADTMVLANCDELFDREEFSAAPDVGWPDCFNSGVFVYQPSEETYSNLVKFALDKGSFDGGDQGLLNLYFSDWAHHDISKHLPFIYNMCSTACYSYLPAFKQFGGNAKIIHFIGNSKPWLQYFDTETQHVQVVSNIQHLQGVVQQWWNIFCSCIHPTLSPEMAPSRAPATICLPFNPSTEHTFHHNSKPNSPSDKTHDYKNVWDPWEAYEELIDNSKNQSQTIDSREYLPQNQSVDLFVPNIDSHHSSPSTNIDSHHSSSNTNIDSHHSSSSTVKPNNDSIEFFESNITSNNSNVEIVHNVESHFESPVSHSELDYSKNQSSHQSNHFITEQPFQSPSPEPEIYESHANVDPSIECNQHARPHSCEPSSSVTNESALHESNEVHESSAGLAGAFARLTIGVPRTPEQAMLEDQLRRQGWEVGNIDYMGRDSFDNIWSKISETLSAGPSPSQPPSVPPVEGPSDAVPKEEAVQAISEIVHVPAEKPVETPKAQTEETVPTPTEAVSQVVSDTFTPPATAQSVEDTQTPISTPTQAEIQSQQSSVQLQEMPKPEIKEVLPTPETPKSVSLASDPLQSFSEPPSVEPNENLSTVEASILPATLPSESSTIQLPDPVSSKPQQDKPGVTECPRAVSTPVSELPKEASKSDSSAAIQESPKTPESSKPTPVSEALVQKIVLPEPPKQDDKPKPTPDPSIVVASSEPNKPGPPESLKLSKPTPVSEGSEQKPALPESPKPLAAKQEDKPKVITPDPSIVPASSEVKKPSTPESPKTPSSQSPKQAPLGKTSVETSKQGALKSEPEKPSEAPKPKEPSAKVSAKSAPPKSGDSPATEQPKASVPKVAAAAPQKLPQSTPKETSEEGPTPPPRKSTGGGAAGGKKSAKSKK